MSCHSLITATEILPNGGQFSSKTTKQATELAGLALWNNVLLVLQKQTPALSQLRGTLLIVELLRFLMCKSTAKDFDASKLSPSVEVDRAWHALLMYPKLYMTQVCPILGDAIIDHDPLGGEDAVQQSARYSATLQHYTRLFGISPSVELWPNSAPIDASEISEQRAAKRQRTVIAVAPESAESAESGESASGESEEEEQSPVSQSAGETITLIVKDQAGEMTFFKVKRTTKMAKVFEAYAERKGVGADTLLFNVDGQRLREDDTAWGLDLEDQDQIECLLQQRGC